MSPTMMPGLRPQITPFVDSSIFCRNKDKKINKIGTAVEEEFGPIHTLFDT